MISGMLDIGDRERGDIKTLPCEVCEKCYLKKPKIEMDQAVISWMLDIGDRERGAAVQRR